MYIIHRRCYTPDYAAFRLDAGGDKPTYGTNPANLLFAEDRPGSGKAL